MTKRLIPILLTALLALSCGREAGETRAALDHFPAFVAFIPFSVQ